MQKMEMKTKNIFSRLASSSADKIEKSKVSYLLKRLFDQAEDAKKENREQLTKTATIAAKIMQPDVAEIKQTPEEEGIDEVAKSRVMKAEKNRQAIEDMVSNSNRTILKVMTVFPWDFYPTSIVVEEKRLTITRRQLFASQVHSIDIKNISNVFINTGILFAQLKIISATFAENEININMLWKDEAILLRRIIEGLRLFIGKDIDTTGYDVDELISKLKELSTTKMEL